VQCQFKPSQFKSARELQFTAQSHGSITTVAPEWSTEEEGMLLQFICQNQKERNWSGLKDASFWNGASCYIWVVVFCAFGG